VGPQSEARALRAARGRRAASPRRGASSTQGSPRGTSGRTRRASRSGFPSASHAGRARPTPGCDRTDPGRRKEVLRRARDRGHGRSGRRRRSSSRGPQISRQ